MVNTVIIFLFYIFTFFLLLSTNVSIPSEMFYYAFLMNKGQVIYRDFIINHGFLVYSFMRLFVWDISLTILKMICIFMQFVNLTLVLYYLKKNSNTLGLFFGGIIYILLSYYFIQNFLWDELFITPLFFGIYMILKNWKTKKGPILIGLLLTFMTWIKLSSGIVIFPVLIVTRSVKPVLVLVISWIFVGLYFAKNNGITGLYNNLIIYNQRFGQYLLRYPEYVIDKRIVFFAAVIAGVSLYILLRKSKNIFHHVLFITMFSLSIWMSFVPCCVDAHLTPVIVMTTVLIGYAFLYIKRPYLYSYIFLLVIFSVFLMQKDKHRYLELYERPVHMTNESKKLASEIRKHIPPETPFYLWSNRVEIYYLLDTPSRVYIPYVFPVVRYMYSDLDEQLIGDIRENNIEYVIRPKPFDDNYIPLTALTKYIMNTYTLVIDTPIYQLYAKVKPFARAL